MCCWRVHLGPQTTWERLKMPIGNGRDQQVLHLLRSHVTWNRELINTHRLNKDHELLAGHRCFNGLEVSDVLIWDHDNTFADSDVSRAIIRTVLAHMKQNHAGYNSLECNALIHGSDIQKLIEIALFSLEKGSVAQAEPEIRRK